MKSKRYRSNLSDKQKPGWKFSEYEMKGVPIRISIGPRDIQSDTVELFRRDTLQKRNVKISVLVDEVLGDLDNMQNKLFEKAKLFTDENTFYVNDFSDFKEKINTGGFVYAHWDGTSETEDQIKKLTKATIRCVPMDREKEKGTCILSGKPSNQRVVFAKSY